MAEVRLDPRQAPVRAELLLAADFGREARGRPIHGRPESEDDGGADEPGPRLKLGAVRTRRLAVSEGTDRPSGSAYGNPLRDTRDNAPVAPIGAPVDPRGWVRRSGRARPRRTARRAWVLTFVWMSCLPSTRMRSWRRPARRMLLPLFLTPTGPF